MADGRKREVEKKGRSGGLTSSSSLSLWCLKENKGDCVEVKSIRPMDTNCDSDHSLSLFLFKV